MSRIRLFSLGMVFALAAGCRDLSDPDALARAFVDAYYVEYDFDRALTMADGPARARLLGEKELVDEARQKVQVANARSRTYYEAPEKHDVGADMVHYTFALEIRQGSSDLSRSAVVMLVRRNGAWKVLGFRESSPGASGGALATGGPDSDGVGTSTRASRARQEVGARSATVAP